MFCGGRARPDLKTLKRYEPLLENLNINPRRPTLPRWQVGMVGSSHFWRLEMFASKLTKQFIYPFGGAAFPKGKTIEVVRVGGFAKTATGEATLERSTAAGSCLAVFAAWTTRTAGFVRCASAYICTAAAKQQVAQWLPDGLCGKHGEMQG